MLPGPDSGRYLDAVVVVFLLAVFLFVSPFVLVWTSPSSPWFVPYLLWLAVIALTVLIDLLRGRDEL